jgi:hypothetical protein
MSAGSPGLMPQGWSAGPTGAATATQWQPRPVKVGFGSRNRNSLVALGLVVAYIFVAATTHIVFLGIAPLMASIRALTRREPLAFLAIAGTVIAIVVAFKALSGSFA